ncbi:MAG: hypothetical protein NXI24_01565 [bacterium]|nr:hypothetical protein [bacterium]
MIISGRLLRYCFIGAFLPYFAACSYSAKVKHAPESLLSSAQIVAVTEMRVNNTIDGSLFDRVAQQVSTIIFEEDLESANLEQRFSEYLIASVNRNFLDRGYAPIQRIKIKQVEQEQAFQQSGLTKNSVRLGELLDAGAVFTGQLNIRQKGGLDYPLALACLVPPLLIIPRPEAEVIFSGELTHVKTGALLASGVSSGRMNPLSADEINKVIEAWFDELPAL